MELPRDLTEKLAEVRSVGVITGAGVSAESGIRTYRGQGGLYDDPDEGDRTVEALTGSTLYSEPDRTWRVVAELARQSGAAEPNPAHHAIAAIERNVERFVLLTQNVDGLHQLAGSRNVIAIHGNVFATRCMSCDARGTLDRKGLQGLEAAPRCSACGGVLRPDAVLFGEMLPVDALARLREELLVNVPGVVIIAGTSALFPYIAEPVVVAQRAGRLTVEVNPEPTYLSGEVDYFLKEKAGAVMPLIAEATNRG
jgi:NAD-dependent deacetylase